MQTATETERKYDVPAGFAMPSLIGTADVASADDAQTHELDATYYDTDDLRLVRHARTLRRRTGGSDAGWHLKTPGDGSSRTEHRMPLDGDAVPDALQAEVRAIVRDRPLAPVARLRTRRVETPLKDSAGRTLALVAEDDVTAETDTGRQSWREIEVELVDGRPGILDAVEHALLAAGATPAAGPSKLARALGDRLPGLSGPSGKGPGGASGKGPGGPSGKGPDSPSGKGPGDASGKGPDSPSGNVADSPSGKVADSPSGEGPGGDGTKINPVLAYAREQRDAIAMYDPGVRRGDAESVHRMRVATRRLRSTLTTFKRTFGAERAGLLRPELKWLAGQLGEVRDGQVLSHKLLGPIEDAGPEFAPVADRVREHLDAKVEAGRAALAEHLNGTRYFGLLDAIDELVADPDAAEKDPVRRARKALERADRLLDTAIADGVDAELHEARKAYKRARYAVEVFAEPVGKPARQLASALSDLQDVLGAHQDSVVAREILRDLGGSAEDAFGYGVLYARQEQVGRDTFGDLPAAIEAAGKDSLRSWLA